MLTFPYGMSGGWDSAEKPARLPEFHRERPPITSFHGAESAERRLADSFTPVFVGAWDLLPP